MKLLRSPPQDDVSVRTRRAGRPKRGLGHAEQADATENGQKSSVIVRPLLDREAEVFLPMDVGIAMRLQVASCCTIMTVAGAMRRSSLRSLRRTWHSLWPTSSSREWAHVGHVAAIGLLRRNRQRHL
jgi:hypothetical protein